MAPLFVFYDESCGFCCGVASVLSKLSPSAVVYQKAADMEQFSQHAKALQNRYRDLHAVMGDKVFRGYDCYLQIAEKTTLLKPLSFMMRLPPVRFIGERVYRHIADHRKCGTNPPTRSG